MSDRPVHLVGSVPLGDAADVFTTCVEALGNRLKRVPDGETGERTNWIAWQRPIMDAHPALQLAGDHQDATMTMPRFALRPDFSGDIAFNNLGYLDAAIASYGVFACLRDAGHIGAQRFQVSLPTPLASIAAYIEQASQEALYPAYRDRLVTEAQEIIAAIPSSDLAIQWDVAIEFAVLEGLFPVWFDHAFDSICDQLAELGSFVPDSVELGFHFCYGDAGNKHFKEPQDMGLLVKVANALTSRATRSIDWLHMPVPIARDDDAYFAPLGHLSLRPDCTLFLGLLHEQDATEGAQRRIDAARRMYPGNFGIATECGLGRRKPEIVRELLKLHTLV